MLTERVKYKTKDISPETFFSDPVYLDEQFILTAPEMPFSRELINALEEWDIPEVYCVGENLGDYADFFALDDELDVQDVPANSSSMMKVEEFYSSFLNYTKNLIVHAAVGNELDFNQVARRIKTLCDMIRQERNAILRVQSNAMFNQEENFLASHSLKSTIISIIIGSYFKLPTHRLIELGVAALLHEIGMTVLSPRIYLSRQALKPLEKKAILSHPARGYNMLKANGFPLSVMLAALEHHERDNGSGYPRNLTGDKISLYAKIIAVACSYEAISAQRPHKEAKDGYTGMVELLKNEGKQYDDTIIRALVYSLSIYPVGLHVLLSNDLKAQVIDVDPEDPRYPIVQISGEQMPGGMNRIIATSQDGIYISRPLSKEEIGAE